MLFHQPANSVGNYAYNAYIYDNVFYRPHFHKNFEIIYVISGEVNCTAGDKIGVIKAGQFAIILSNHVHSLQSVGNSVCWVGVFSGDYVRAFEKKIKDKTGSSFIFDCDNQTLSFLQYHLISESPPSIYLLKACLYALCDQYLKSTDLLPQTQKSGLMMRRVTDYISSNYQSKITLAHLAKELGYNYHYMSRCFARIFDMPFTEFLNSYRLDAALEMLIETDKDITDIALESGFQSIRNFNNFFKAHIGTTPAKYRGAHK